MEEKKKTHMCEVCDSHSMDCCGRYHRQYHILRWLLIIIVALMIFSLGMKVGEMKGIFDSEFSGGYRQMRYGNMMYERGFDVSTPVSGRVMVQPTSVGTVEIKKN